jgi:hypothetical protein
MSLRCRDASEEGTAALSAPRGADGDEPLPGAALWGSALSSSRTRSRAVAAPCCWRPSRGPRGTASSPSGSCSCMIDSRKRSERTEGAPGDNCPGEYVSVSSGGRTIACVCVCVRAQPTRTPAMCPVLLPVGLRVCSLDPPPPPPTLFSSPCCVFFPRSKRLNALILLGHLFAATAVALR